MEEEILFRAHSYSSSYGKVRLTQIALIISQ